MSWKVFRNFVVAGAMVAMTLAVGARRADAGLPTCQECDSLYYGCLSWCTYYYNNCMESAMLQWQDCINNQVPQQQCDDQRTYYEGQCANPWRQACDSSCNSNYASCYWDCTP